MNESQSTSTQAWTCHVFYLVEHDFGLHQYQFQSKSCSTRLTTRLFMSVCIWFEINLIFARKNFEKKIENDYVVCFQYDPLVSKLFLFPNLVSKVTKKLFSTITHLLLWIVGISTNYKCPGVNLKWTMKISSLFQVRKSRPSISIEFRQDPFCIRTTNE